MTFKYETNVCGVCLFKKQRTDELEGFVSSYNQQ